VKKHLLVFTNRASSNIRLLTQMFFVEVWLW